MEYIITERQYRLISEQIAGLSPVGGYDYQKPKAIQKSFEELGISPHTLANVLGVVTLFIPVVGPAISLGIAAADAALYYSEGDKKTAAMIAMFPFLPLGKLSTLIPGIKNLGKDGMIKLAKKLGQGGKNLSSLEKKVVEGIGQNEEVFNQELKRISNKLSEKTKQVSFKNFGERFNLGECFSNEFCPAFKAILSGFYSKLANSAKLTKFYPSEVKVLSREIVAGREVIETQLKDGTKILFYKSSGSNVGTTGKKAGEWFVIPGFAQNGWFFKTKETVNLTKGGNKYLTDMAEFLNMNGSQMLGK